MESNISIFFNLVDMMALHIDLNIGVLFANYWILKLRKKYIKTRFHEIEN